MAPNQTNKSPPKHTCSHTHDGMGGHFMICFIVMFTSGGLDTHTHMTVRHKPEDTKTTLENNFIKCSRPSSSDPRSLPEYLILILPALSCPPLQRIFLTYLTAYHVKKGHHTRTRPNKTVFNYVAHLLPPEPIRSKPVRLPKLPCAADMTTFLRLFYEPKPLLPPASMLLQWSGVKRGGKNWGTASGATN